MPVAFMGRLNDPPRIPTRSPVTEWPQRISVIVFRGEPVPRRGNVLECGELFDTYRPAGMQPAGRYADFRAHAELSAISELGRALYCRSQSRRHSCLSAVAASSLTIESV